MSKLYNMPDEYFNEKSEIDEEFSNNTLEYTLSFAAKHVKKYTKFCDLCCECKAINEFFYETDTVCAKCAVNEL